MAYALPVTNNKGFTPNPIIFKHIDNLVDNTNAYQNGGPNHNHRGNQNTYSLCLKGVPSELNQESLKLILNKYGTVVRIGYSKPYYFADCATEKDFQAIIKGMKNNSLHIRVEPKTDTKSQNDSDQQNHQHMETNSNLSYNTNRSSTDRRNNRRGEHERRLEYKVVKEKSIPFVCPTKVLQNISTKAKEESNDNIQKQCANSVKKNETIPNPCYKCRKPSNQICERCDAFYCSTECQINDWQMHRYYCFKMPKLITIKVDENKENFKRSHNQNNNLSLNELKQTKKIDDSNNQQKKLLSNDSQKNVQHQNEQISKVKLQNVTNNENKSRTRRSSYRNRYQKSSGGNNRKQEAPNQKQIAIHDNSQETKIPDSKQVQLPVVNKPIKAEMPKSGDKVFMTHFEGSNVVYIRSQRDNDNYREIITKVIEFSKKANYIKKIPNVNDYVTTMYEGCWVRAIVLDNRNPQQISIGYVDFGNSELKDISELKELVPECYNLTRYPSPILLKNIPNRDITCDFTNYMTQLINAQAELKIFYTPDDIINNKTHAELFIHETNENLNNICIELLKLPTPKVIKEPVMFDDIKTELLPKGENISIIIVGQSMIQNGIIHCISPNEYKKLNDLNDKIKNYAESNRQQYSPRQGEMCIAKYENGKWYRAYCDEVNSDNDYYELIFLDYGNDLRVFTNDIRKYSTDFTLQCHTYDCQISGLEDLVDCNDINPQLEDRLRELLPLDKEMCVDKIVSYVTDEGDFMKLYLPHVVDTLQREGLLGN